MKTVKMLMMAVLTILSFTPFAQDTTGLKTNSYKEKTGKVIYSCPMHADVTSDKPGKCSKCGINLIEKEIKASVYACPMKCEGDKTYDKPGKCPVCGMNLKEKKDDNSNHHD